MRGEVQTEECFIERLISRRGRGAHLNRNLRGRRYDTANQCNSAGDCNSFSKIESNVSERAWCFSASRNDFHQNLNLSIFKCVNAWVTR